MIDTWETTTFRRIECIGENSTDALRAVEERLRVMRRAGWEFPEDTVIDLRLSGFGWAARLQLPERNRVEGGWAVRRRLVVRPARTMSGVVLRITDLEIAREA